jgi:hypothetical protein
MENLKIDFDHALVSVMDALEYSNNVTLSEFKLVKSLLLKAQAANQPMKCPSCGSTKCGMVDYEPLAYGKDLEMYGQYDEDLYAHFECQECNEEFRKVLKISHQ